NQERIISLNKATGLLLGIDQVQAQGRSLQEVVRNADLRRFVTARYIAANLLTTMSCCMVTMKASCRHARRLYTTRKAEALARLWCSKTSTPFDVWSTSAATS